MAGANTDQPARWRRSGRELVPSGWSPGTRYSRLATARASAVLSLLALFVINFAWFSTFGFRTIAGDDLRSWLYFTGHPSLRELVFDGSSDKYRPVTNVVQYVLFQVFSSDYRSWVAFNTVLNCLIVAALFLLIRELAEGDSIIALFGGLLYLTSRFSYYNVLQMNGVMEALGLLLLVLIMYVTLRFYVDSRPWPGYVLAGLYLLITLTHERYLVLLPFLLLVPLLHESLSRRSKVGLMALMCVPFALNLVLKLFVLDSTLLMGTEGKEIAIDPLQVAGFVVAGLKNMVWINTGHEALSGRSFLLAATLLQTLVVIICVTLLVIVIWMTVRIARAEAHADRRRQLRGFVLWSVLFLSLLLAASITIRQEFRWLYPPFVVLVTYFCYQYARLPMRTLLKYGLLAVLCLLAVTVDGYYKAHEDSVFFMGWQRGGDLAYDLTMGKYGQGMRERTLYVDESSSLQGAFQGDLFLRPYLGRSYRGIVWMDNLARIDPAAIDQDRSLFMWVDWSLPTPRLLTSDSDFSGFAIAARDGWSTDDWVAQEGKAAVVAPVATDARFTLSVPDFIPANRVVVRLDDDVVFDASVAGGTTRSVVAHLHEGLHIVRVTCKHAVSPASVGVSGDVRPLGCRVTMQKP